MVLFPLLILLATAVAKADTIRRSCRFHSLQNWIALTCLRRSK
jgi:hypothetical protein